MTVTVIVTLSGGSLLFRHKFIQSPMNIYLQEVFGVDNLNVQMSVSIQLS